MFKITRKSRLVKVAAATAAIGSLAAIGFAGNSPANADPKQYSALVGYGSDTTQDVMNAMAGFAGGQPVTPIAATDPFKTQLASWDAFPAGQCIVPRTGSPTILRPNGSTAGLRMLSRAYSPGNYLGGTCGDRNVSGMIDFARSSSGPSGSNQNLVWIPFGRDAITWAYSKPSATTAPVTNLTPTQLTALMGTGPQVISNGTTDVVVIPCGIQTSSGTYRTWNGMNGLSTATGATPDQTATAFCRGLVTPPGAVLDSGGRLQESNGPELKAKADALAGVVSTVCDPTPPITAVDCADAQVIVGYAASGFIARSKGNGTPLPGPGVALGSISGVAPITGNSPATYAPNAAFYNSLPPFGRDVFNVLAKEVIDDGGNTAVQTMFVGPSSAVCQATTTILNHGFLTLGSACGGITQTGSFVAN